tara:strand:+ start:605 stop:928 length:324 start_codon:yes stop_codon:yes gene_type:complete
MNFEKLKEMNKTDLIDMWKDIVFPYRVRGGINIVYETKTVQRKDWRGNWYDYELTSSYIQERNGTNMSDYRPKVGEDEYTWSAIEKYPADMVRIFLFNILSNRAEEE